MPDITSQTFLSHRNSLPATSVLMRSARPRDAQAIHDIIAMYADQRLMLPRTLMQIYEHLRDYVVAELGATVVGVGALHYYWEDLAEIRALAVAPAHKSLGIGRRIVLYLFEEARAADLRRVFAFTYVPAFFSKLGFVQVPHSSLPLKVWKDCINCSFFNNCNEIAMIKDL